jgi:hypothetical protein
VKYPRGITACAQPRMTNHRGRTWDECTVTLPDGSTTKGYYDTTWGFFFYFKGDDGKWRKGDIGAFDTGKSSYIITPDLRHRPALLSANDLRKLVAADPKIDFDFWVRGIKKGPLAGTIWVGSDARSITHCEKLMSRLQELGFKALMKGEKGTAGEYIIDVIPESK